MKMEHAVIVLDVFRDDGEGTKDLDAIWKNLCDALYQIAGVERVSLRSRAVTYDGAPLGDD